MRILEDTAELEAWIEQLVAGMFDDVIWLTGEGLRRLLGIAEHKGRRSVFIDALGRVRMITRGPKPARMLHQLGLMPDLAAATPTSQGVLDALAGEHINGRGIGLQPYPGEGGVPLVSELRRRGAVIFPVTPYRYASQTETTRVLDMVSALASGRIDMIAFTSSPQVERLFEVAREAGIAKQLDEVLQHTRIAAIGPIVEQTLRLHGVTAILRPETSFHLKPFVREIQSFVLQFIA